MRENGTTPQVLPAPDAPRGAWIAWLVAYLQGQWSQAIIRADMPGMKPPGVRRGVMPDIEFWYPNEAGVHTLLHLYRVLPTSLLGTRDALDELSALLGYCRANGRQLTLVVPDRPLQQEELEALDSVLIATVSPMLFEVAAYQIA